MVAKRVKRFLLRTPAGRVLLTPMRLGKALGYYTPALGRAFKWALESRELTNFTYPITEKNKNYLAHTISVVTGVSHSLVMGYFDEVEADEDLKQHVVRRIREGPKRYACDESCVFGRRLGWYMFVRILKPAVVVETGVDKGHGAVLLCTALMRNEAEGFPGRYLGTDINPEAGFLLSAPYDRVGSILYGDSISSLQSIPRIDCFINDSDHSESYERREYETIISKLGPRGVILGDNCHCNDVLATFSAEQKREFLFFHEEPKNHWYPGGGIGISFIKNSLRFEEGLKRSLPQHEEDQIQTAGVS